MKLFIAVVLCFINLVTIGQENYSDSLKKERLINERDFLYHVLNEAERKEHPEICYFEPDTNFIVRARFNKEIGEIFDFPKTNNKTSPYRKYGTLTFYLHDTLCTLNVYQNMELKGQREYKYYFFVPFKDATTSKSTYGAGRYLDCSIKKKQEIVILDFNTAYHPYCAYSFRYSCPLVPSVNFLSVAIPAGECFYEHE